MPESYWRLISTEEFIIRKLLKKLLPKRRLKACTIPRDQHPISRSLVSENALKVLYRLKETKFEAYLVGGCVRDLLLNKHPKDFDVATSAHPEELYRLFRNCRLIGRRFRLAHISFRDEIIEVATFRRGHGDADEEDAKTKNGLIIRDNAYGTIAEDALRRDFTINALYYNIKDFSIVDFVNGFADLQHGIIRTIGNPKERFREDPVRILRAVRFASQLKFTLEPKTQAALNQALPLLKHIASARLFLEILKSFHNGYAHNNFRSFTDHGLLPYLFPSLSSHLVSHHVFFEKFLKNTDERVAQDKPVSPGFLFATLLWPAVVFSARKLPMEDAMQKVLHEQLDVIAIPKRFTAMMREVWRLQYYLKRRHPRSILRTFTHPRFRAAFDLLQLRVQAGESVQEAVTWWEDFQMAEEEEREALINELR